MGRGRREGQALATVNDDLYTKIMLLGAWYTWKTQWYLQNNSKGRDSKCSYSGGAHTTRSQKFKGI